MINNVGLFGKSTQLLNCLTEPSRKNRLK